MRYKIMANTGVKIGESLTNIRLKMKEAVETRSVVSFVFTSF